MLIRILAILFIAVLQVMGQTADLFDLQRLLLRSRARQSDAAQQNVTRWAVWSAAAMLRRHGEEHAALVAAMRKGASMAECVQAIESAGAGSGESKE